MLEIACCGVLLVNFVLITLFILAFTDKKDVGGKWKFINKMRNALIIEEEVVEECDDGQCDCGRKSTNSTNNTDWSAISEGDTFTLDGVSYDVLLIFKGDSENEKYIVYTDNSIDEDGNFQLFASIYNPDVSKELISVDEKDEEWVAIKRVLNIAVEKSCIKSTRAKNKIECPEGEFNPFVTFCYLANAIAENGSKKDPFILATTGEEACNEVTGVILSGTIGDIEDAFKHIVTSIAKRYKTAGLTQNGAFDNLLCIMLEAVNEAYKSKLRQEVENLLGYTDEIDIRDYLDEE